MFQSFFINFVAASVVHAFERIKMENLKLYIRACHWHHPAIQYPIYGIHVWTR